MPPQQIRLAVTVKVSTRCLRLGVSRWVPDFVWLRPDGAEEIKARALLWHTVRDQLVGVHPRWEHVSEVILAVPIAFVIPEWHALVLDERSDLPARIGPGNLRDLERHLLGASRRLKQLLEIRLLVEGIREHAAHAEPNMAPVIGRRRLVEMVIGLIVVDVRHFEAAILHGPSLKMNMVVAVFQPGY